MVDGIANQSAVRRSVFDACPGDNFICAEVINMTRSQLGLSVQYDLTQGCRRVMRARKPVLLGHSEAQCAAALHQGCTYATLCRPLQYISERIFDIGPVIFEFTLYKHRYQNTNFSSL